MGRGLRLRKTARRLDAMPDDRRGPLHGLPITIKINVDFAGLPNSNGIPALNAAPVTQDSPLVASLKQDGAVVIGRTNTPEFSLRWFTSNPIYGVTKNPVNKALTPGGSSGGAASAVAAGMGVFGHGNDLGGSLRYPAYCCGLTTLRPSLGRVPAFNPSAPAERPATLQMMSVQGAIARNVADMRLAMASLQKRSSRDPLWNNAPDSGRSRGAKLRIGVCVDPFGDGVAPEVAAGVEIAAAALVAQGCRRVDIVPPLAIETATAWGTLLNAETFVMMIDAMKSVGSPEVINLLERYADVYPVPTLKGFMQQQAMRLTAQRAWSMMFDDIDALLTPVSAAEPFGLELDFKSPERTREILMAQRVLFLANVLGLPAASVPTGMNKGVPMGVQIIGAWRDDNLCLDLAQAIETGLGTNVRPVNGLTKSA